MIDSLRQQDTAAELGCDNPDFILALETPGQMAMRAVYALEAVQFDFQLPATNQDRLALLQPRFSRGVFFYLHG